jgi:hypothetical protein
MLASRGELIIEYADPRDDILFDFQTLLLYTSPERLLDVKKEQQHEAQDHGMRLEAASGGRRAAAGKAFA